jgi:hypothetical protein
LDHDNRLAIYYCNSDDNIIISKHWVFDPVGVSKARFLHDKFLNGLLGLHAITSIRYNLNIFVQQTLDEIERVAVAVEQ